MKWNIVTDSSCDLMREDIACEEARFATIPFTIRVGRREFEDNEALNTAQMLETMESSKEVGGTACPSPGAWANEFGEAEHTIALTISEKLSGSYNSANVAKDMTLGEAKDKKIAVLNSKSTGPAIALCIKRVAEWIKQGETFETISEKAEELLTHTKTVFALCSFDNLVKNGRMNRLTGFIAKKLSMWGIGVGSNEGKIEIKGKTRGVSGVINSIIEDMKQRDFHGAEVIISHCHNLALAEKLRDKVKERWADAKITILKTRGLDSFYAERGGLIVAFC